MRLRVALAGILAVAAGTAVGVALAGGQERRGLQTFGYTSATTTVAGGAQGVAAASCSSGEVAGGGIGVTPARRGSEVASSRPNAPSWEAWANNDRAPASNAVLVSHVFCAQGIPIDLSHSTRAFVLPANRTRTGRRACPAGEQVVSGGVYLTSGGTGAEVPSMGPYDGPDGDRRPDDGFAASASGDGEGQQTVTVHAICSSDSVVRYPSAERRLPARGVAAKTVACPGISSTTGGGATVSRPNLRVELFASKPVDTDADADPSPGNAWRGGAFNGTRKPRTLRVTAICVEPEL